MIDIEKEVEEPFSQNMIKVTEKKDGETFSPSKIEVTEKKEEEPFSQNMINVTEKKDGETFSPNKIEAIEKKDVEPLPFSTIETAEKKDEEPPFPCVMIGIAKKVEEPFSQNMIEVIEKKDGETFSPSKIEVIEKEEEEPFSQNIINVTEKKDGETFSPNKIEVIEKKDVESLSFSTIEVAEKKDEEPPFPCVMIGIEKKVEESFCKDKIEVTEKKDEEAFSPSKLEVTEKKDVEPFSQNMSNVKEKKDGEAFSPSKIEVIEKKDMEVLPFSKIEAAEKKNEEPPFPCVFEAIEKEDEGAPLCRVIEATEKKDGETFSPCKMEIIEKKNEEPPFPCVIEAAEKKDAGSFLCECEDTEKKDEDLSLSCLEKNASEKKDEGISSPGKQEESAEDIIEMFCSIYSSANAQLSELRGAGNNEEANDFRGGAGGSNATKKKRDIGDCLDMIASILKYKTNVEEAQELEELIKEAKGHLGSQKQGQCFYGKIRADSNNEEGKGGSKGKSKTKGKTKKEDELPRFDLSRRWPKTQQTTWQSLHKSLEEGEVPKGEIAIVKSVQQLRQLQTLAQDLKINKSMLLVAKRIGTDDIPDSCQSLLLPWMGNLAMIDAVVGNLNRQKPNLEKEKINERKMETAKRDDLVSLRLTAPWKYISEKNKQILQQKPEYSARLLDDSLKEARTNRWESSESLLTGYLMINKQDVGKMMNCSGKNGIFVTRLSQDIVVKPAALWITRLNDESHHDYLQRTIQEANGAPLTWRRGDGNDLGYHCKEEDITDKTWAVWGIPPYNGPGMVEDWLEQQGWKLKTRPLPPRGRGSPWKIMDNAMKSKAPMPTRPRLMAISDAYQLSDGSPAESQKKRPFRLAALGGSVNTLHMRRLALPRFWNPHRSMPIWMKKLRRPTKPPHHQRRRRNHQNSEEVSLDQKG